MLPRRPAAVPGSRPDTHDRASQRDVTAACSPAWPGTLLCMCGAINIHFGIQIGAVAMLLKTEDGADAYLGTCFPFRWRHVYLTARHCVGELEPDQLVVVSQGDKRFRIREVHRHETVDIAAVVGDEAERGIPYAFSGLHAFEGTYGLGDAVAAFGFPVGGTLEEPPNKPTPRAFRGYVQRLTRFKSGGSEPYTAYELSFAAPDGLSGGPVFVPGSDRVFAMVTGNLMSYTTLMEEVQHREGGEVRTVEGRQIVSYGMALSLWHVEDWLKDVAPLSGHAIW
jgi:trypsin-like peptidase